MHQRLLFILIFVCLQGFGLAQVMGEYDVKVDVDSVFLNVSVRERATNRSIAGLERNDFLVYEDGILQEVQQFLPTESPFNLLLLLDVSGSTGSYLKMMKHAAIEFTRQINADDRIAVVTFNSKVRLVEDFTADRQEAERAIKRIRSGGGTAFYDALMACVTQYMNGIQGRSAIVVFTDGVDNQLEGMLESGSKIRFEDLYRRIQEIDPIIYTVFLNTDMDSRLTSISGWPGGRRGGGGFPGSFPFPFPFPLPSTIPGPNPHPIPEREGDAVYRLAREQLQLIADQTGGRMYSPNKIAELSGVYSEIAGDLRIQYQLGYNSTNRNHDGSWRKILVQLESNPEAVIRTRRGYFARKEMTQ